MSLRVGFLFHSGTFLLAAAFELSHPVRPVFSAGGPRAQVEGVLARSANPKWPCPVNASATCPHSGQACAGAVCCPAAGNAETTFPCPSAPADFSGCANNTKVWDCFLGATVETVAGSELIKDADYKYGKFEASIQYATMDGIISSFFLWKPESEKPDVFWNELDYEKIGLTNTSQCNLGLNLISGLGAPVGNEHHIGDVGAICGGFHTYVFEWTPDYVKWTMDGVELHRMTGPIIEEFNGNATMGMQFRFNVWPGDERFGGVFDITKLPVYEYIDWVRYSSYNGQDFTFEWQEDFDSNTRPAGWSVGTWGSPYQYSVHREENIVFKDGLAILALTQSWEVPTADSIPPAGERQTTPAPATTPSDDHAPGASQFGMAVVLLCVLSFGTLME